MLNFGQSHAGRTIVARRLRSTRCTENRTGCHRLMTCKSFSDSKSARCRGSSWQKDKLLSGAQYSCSGIVPPRRNSALSFRKSLAQPYGRSEIQARVPRFELGSHGSARPGNVSSAPFPSLLPVPTSQVSHVSKYSLLSYHPHPPSTPSKKSFFTLLSQNCASQRSKL
jgi:hypothetical protein